MRQCLLIDSPELTAFKCQNEPIYVLSRTCTDEYYGAAGPCCKVDVALNWLVNIQTELFSHIKFLLHCDDDMYWRPLQTLRWLASVQNSGANMYPLVANAKDADVNSHGVWHIENCKEIHTSGWYQPLMLNHIALQMIGPAAAAYGVRDTCTAFDVTHDVGIGIFFWLYGLFHIQMPFTGINPSHKGVALLKPTDMAMHCIKHSNSEAECSEWKGEDRYKQNKVVGCGDVGEPSPHHDRAAMADMVRTVCVFEVCLCVYVCLCFNVCVFLNVVYIHTSILHLTPCTLLCNPLSHPTL